MNEKRRDFPGGALIHNDGKRVTVKITKDGKEVIEEMSWAEYEERFRN